MLRAEDPRAVETAQLEQMLKATLLHSTVTEEKLYTNLELLAAVFGKKLGPEDLTGIATRISHDLLINTLEDGVE